jgi:hypothetical protein
MALRCAGGLVTSSKIGRRRARHSREHRAPNAVDAERWYLAYTHVAIIQAGVAITTGMSRVVRF